ncbi:MAG: putative two-component response regulator [Myxococcaceae bacterium]|nr:putative two-component response regulator [Myxococcaceae bacterium]
MSTAHVTRRSVVIADDDQDVAKVLARVVRALGHETRIASNGQEALEMLRIERADVLLSDIDMPHMDGVTLVSHVRAEALAPVRILLTANARLDTALKAINSGEVHRYIQKPWKHDELVATLEEAFSRIDDLSRIGAADQAARRWKAARDALEAEFPGITHVELERETYRIDPIRARAALQLFDGTTLHALVTGAQESDVDGNSMPPPSKRY